ncbi:oxygen-sensing cyclic-di-GMP phosphodiesterase DosP [Citrobacter amalonaticus]|uniref:oxygen-sensing cyclic-di-GMP phosphodiesterase DosP n=1 Tax=Citrobacter amalonaticus TaxID=35703 RepID=UPI001A336720|nr:oxygen-sensing cyclic-di-GMP phosphodiesterase [Citrobacter amalonaticus]HDQ2813316.1 oxygen-sensing cyclic-di-GMP phosphodiesterase [Citrobacter amalonaticus]
MKTGNLSVNPEETILFPALEQSMMAVVLTDDNDIVRFFNQAAEHLWGYGREDVLGRNVNMLIPATLRQQHPSFIKKNREGGHNSVVGMNRELQLERKDRSLVWTSFALSKVNVNGRVYYLAMARDVTVEVQRQEQNRLLLMAMAHTDQPVIVLSPDSLIVQVNRAFTDMFDFGAEEVTSLPPEDVLFSGVHEDERNRFGLLLQGNDRRAEELRVMTRRGRDIWVRVCAIPVSDDKGRICNRVLTFTDVTENQKIRILEKEVLVMLVGDQPFAAVGETLCRVAESVLPGWHISLYRETGETRQLWAQGGAPAATRGTTEMQTLMLPISHNDNARAGLLVMTYSGEQPVVERFAERVAESCTYFASLALEHEYHRHQIEQLQQFDSLTGLPARNKLHHCLDKLLQEHPDKSTSIFSLGIDNFSHINEILGYAAADKLLLAMAERLRNFVGPEQYLCRTEGIQFVVVAPGFDASDASLFAGRLKDTMSEPLLLDGEPISLSVSTGISLWPEPGGSRDSLLAAARSAMERIRDAGGNGWQFFDADVSQRIKEDQQLATALKNAIVEGRLTLHYQPQVNAYNGELYGVEALARWHDPVFGMVSPLRFVPIAEKTGEMEHLGYWVLKEACRQMAEWRQQGLEIPCVSVNLSPRNLQDPALLSFITERLKEYGLPGERLTLEVTENDMVELSDSMMARLNTIRSLGVGLSVDDFGTGFSGLLNLAKLPVTEIKIDKSFIDGMMTEKRSRALTEAMTGIGHSLELAIVAEGVETQEQMDLLRQLRCPVIQGYLFSPPLPAQKLAEWVLKRGRDN